MKHLVIGGRGLVGSALVQRLSEREDVFWQASYRTGGETPGWFKYDVAQGPVQWLPHADVVYVVAANPKIVECDRNQVRNWTTNADGPAQIAVEYQSRWLSRAFGGEPGHAEFKAFLIFVSSDYVEFGGTSSYARAKAYAEPFYLMSGGAVVRPSRIPADRANDFADFLITIGERRTTGIHRWAA